jgi:hypothetical protein
MAVNAIKGERAFNKGVIRCPHLIKWAIHTCKAGDKPYAPSLFELMEYCTTGDHRKCPFYFRNKECRGIS